MVNCLKPKTIVAFFSLLLAAFGGGSFQTALADPSFYKGQTVYVPVYSHIYSGDREQPFYLAATLSIRNTDRIQAITITPDLFPTYRRNPEFIQRFIFPGGMLPSGAVPVMGIVTFCCPPSTLTVPIARVPS